MKYPTLPIGFQTGHPYRLLLVKLLGVSGVSHEFKESDWNPEPDIGCMDPVVSPMRLRIASSLALCRTLPRNTLGITGNNFETSAEGHSKQESPISTFQGQSENHSCTVYHR